MKRAGLLGLLLVFASVSFGQEGGTPNSEWMYVGSTWWDYQATGSVGRLIAVGSNEDVHFVWTNGLDYDSDQRYAYYNCWDESSGSLSSWSGSQIGLGTRSGYPTLALHSSGFALSMYNEHVLVGGTSVAAAYDFFPCIGAFMSSPLDSVEAEPYWPKIDVDPFDRMHVVLTTSDPIHNHLYARAYLDDSGGVPEINWDIPLAEIADENIVFPTIDIGCSRHSEKVVTAWIERPPSPHDPANVIMRVSEDGGLNWGAPVSVTDLPPIDTMCVINGGSPTVCNGDTFRPWYDLSLILDDNDNVHVAFSAHGYWYFDAEGEANPTATIGGTIWHWNSETEQFSLIGEAWQPPDPGIDIGAYNLMCHKPSLAIDTISGNLYCAYQQFDPHAFSDCPHGIGEYYLSVSTDNGLHWAVPTNVSNTPGEPNMPAGETPSEQDISLAKYVTNGYIHALYMHDYWAGVIPQIECGHWLNAMVYMKTPVTDILTTPLNPPWEFRATGTPVSEEEVALPAEFMLYQNYPNPFNPSTNIQFDLARAGVVKLVVFDVTGREVETLVDNVQMNAGVHTVAIDGAGLASGVYLARLEMDGTSMTRKMVLLK
jgi:hypothetical protein